MNVPSGQWPPPYEGFVFAPAGEPASPGWRLPSRDSLEYTQTALRLLFLIFALIGAAALVHRGESPWFQSHHGSNIA